ncbi:MAG: hypothetical protein M1114_03305 [Candidatus Dependentiae bacterium]|nr:hypothetical protein [Candidatus Dependentiae bacterium]
MRLYEVRYALTCIMMFILPGCRFEHNVVRRVCITHKADAIATELDIDSYYTCNSDNQEPKTITIWVHGTQLFAQAFFHALFQEKEQLKHFSEIPRGCDLRETAHTLIASAPSIFAAEDFYIFGWSGSLSFSARQEAAKNLYYEIQRIKMEYLTTHGQTPRIRIITHSHGGNVVLGMGKLNPHDQPYFHVDQLILLACPVQEHTKHNIKHAMFKQSYSLYSRLDIMQIIDPQGLYGPEGLWNSSFLSERRFPSDRRVHQIKIRMNKRAITHHEFILPSFLEQLAIVINEIDIWQQQKSFDSCKIRGIRHLISIETKNRRARNAL